MKLVLNTTLKNLVGEDMGITVGQAAANMVLFVKEDPMRAFTLAQKLYNDAEIELSPVEYEFLKDAVKKHGLDAYTSNLAAGQILVILSNLKENA